MLGESGIPQNDVSIAPIIKELDNVFEQFNKQFFDSALLKAAITLSQKGTKSAKGWCTKEKVWARTEGEQVLGRYYEINICPKYLNRPMEEICEMLLHEMVHLFNITHGLQDCGSNGQYHNKRFKESAEQHGLNVERIPNYGYAKTSLKPETVEFISSLNLTAFDLFRDTVRKNAAELEIAQQRQSSTRKYICPKCKTSIRATKKVQVICNNCNEFFVECGRQAKDESSGMLPVIRRKD